MELHHCRDHLGQEAKLLPVDRSILSKVTVSLADRQKIAKVYTPRYQNQDGANAKLGDEGIDKRVASRGANRNGGEVLTGKGCMAEVGLSRQRGTRKSFFRNS